MQCVKHNGYHVWGYEHIGRRIEVVVVHMAGEVDHIEAATVVPTGSAVDMAAAGHIAGEVVADSIGFVVVELGLGMETLAIVGSRETEGAGLAAVGEVYYNLIALVGRVMRVRHMGQE